MSSLGERLKASRQSKGLSQNDVAGRLQVAKSTISQYESNKRRPDPDTLAALAILYKVSADKLLGIEAHPVFGGEKADQARKEFETKSEKWQKELARLVEMAEKDLFDE